MRNLKTFSENCVFSRILYIQRYSSPEPDILVQLIEAMLDLLII